MDQESDAELVLAARDGDQHAFAALYDRYVDGIHRYCTMVLRDRDEAADAVQDTFLIAARSLGRLREPARVRSWLYAVARHEAVRRGRSAARAVPTEDIGDRAGNDRDQDATVNAEDAARVVWDAAAGLNERDQSLLALHVREGLDGDELARAMGVRTGSVYMMVNRLKAQVERSIGALLLARGDRSSCVELQAMLAGWDGSFSPLIRKRVARHADACATCGEQRSRLASPLALLGVLPVLPAPAAMRQRVLDGAALASSSRAPVRGLGRDGFPRPRVSWREIGAGIAVGAIAGGGLTLGLRAIDGADEPPATASVTATVTTGTTTSATAAATGEFTSYPGTPPSPPSPNRVVLTIPPGGGIVDGSSTWAVDAGAGPVTVTGSWTGTYDAATGQLAGTAAITTTGPAGEILGSGTAAWTASHDATTGAVDGTLESPDGPWQFRVALV